MFLNVLFFAFDICFIFPLNRCCYILFFGLLDRCSIPSVKIVSFCSLHLLRHQIFSTLFLGPLALSFLGFILVPFFSNVSFVLCRDGFFLVNSFALALRGQQIAVLLQLCHLLTGLGSKLFEGQVYVVVAAFPSVAGAAIAVTISSIAVFLFSSLTLTILIVDILEDLLQQIFTWIRIPIIILVQFHGDVSCIHLLILVPASLKIIKYKLNDSLLKFLIQCIQLLSIFMQSQQCIDFFTTPTLLILGTFILS